MKFDAKLTVIRAEPKAIDAINFVCLRYLLGSENNGHGEIYRYCKTFKIYSIDDLIKAVIKISPEHYLYQAAEIFFKTQHTATPIFPKNYLQHFILFYLNDLKFPEEEA